MSFVVSNLNSNTMQNTDKYKEKYISVYLDKSIRSKINSILLRLNYIFCLHLATTKIICTALFFKILVSFL